jgi:hypothetical protein
MTKVTRACMIPGGARSVRLPYTDSRSVRRFAATFNGKDKTE